MTPFIERVQGRGNKAEPSPTSSSVASEVIHALGTDLSNQSTNSIDQIEFDGRLVENYTTEPTED